MPTDQTAETTPVDTIGADANFEDVFGGEDNNLVPVDQAFVEPPTETTDGEETKEETDDSTADAKSDEEKQAEDSATPDPATETKPIEIDGKPYSLDELKELVSKGTDYTKKTQELAVEREQHAQDLEAGQIYRNVLKALTDSPEAAAKVVDELSKYAKNIHGEKFAAPTETFDDETLSDEGKVINGELRRTRAELAQVKATNAKLESDIHAVRQFIDKHGAVLAESSLRAAAEPVIAQIKAKYNITATSDDLVKAVKETGVQNPLDAWKLHNFDEVTRLTAQQAAEAARTAPRNTPKGGPKTFDPTKLSAGEIFKHLSQGHQPTES